MDLQELLFKDDLQFRNQKRQLWIDVYLVFIKSQTTNGAVKEANAAVQEFSKTFTKPKEPNQ
jgi:hypothetical protein